MSVDKSLYKDKKLTKEQQKKIKPVNQGGGPNYLGKQKTVTVPKKWLSSPDHVVAELAYITPREQKILLDANIYGSLKGKPNKGPGGVMSLQGDLGGYDASPGGPDSGGPGGNRVGQVDKNKQRVQDILRGNVTTGQTVAVSDRTRRNAMPEYVNTPAGMRYVGSAKKFVGKSLFNPSGYRNVVGTRGILDRLLNRENIKTRGVPGTPGFEYYSEDEDVGDVKPGIGGRVLGGLLSLITGVPFVGSMIGSAIDKYKPKSMYDDMSEFKNLQLVDGELVDTRNIEPTKIALPSNVPVESLALQRFFDNQKKPTQEIKFDSSGMERSPIAFGPSYNYSFGIPDPTGEINTDRFTSSDGLGIYSGS